jgi:hypothetical protein
LPDGELPDVHDRNFVLGTLFKDNNLDNKNEESIEAAVDE